MFNFGLNRSKFREEIFEKTPWLVRSCFDASRFGWSTIDRALDLQDPTRELVKVLHKGRVDPSDYVEEFVDVGLRRRRILKHRLYELMESGATLVLNRIELVSPSVREVCLEIGRLIGAQTTSNAYACLGGEPATNVHWDTHDVFVVQIGGRKRWQIYKPTHPLPISSQVSNERKDEVPDTPLIDEILEAGDMMYVPRGWWHRVTPVVGSDTLHLTVAVHTPLILDYFVWACGSVFPNLLEARHSVLGEQQDEQRITDAVAAIGRELQRPEVMAAFYSRSRQRERVASPFDIATLLHHSDSSLPLSTSIILNARYADEAITELIVNGLPMPLNGNHLSVVQTLASGTCFSLEDLGEAIPSIAPDALQLVVRDLVRADIIQLADVSTNAVLPALAS